MLGTIAAGRRLLGLLSCVALMLVTVGTLRAADSEDPPWRVGLASVSVTPEGPIRMAGYSSRTEPSKGVLADLHAKAIAIEDAGGHQALMITADLIGFRGSLAKIICDRITQETGLKREQIMLCPSHTHAGPVMGFSEANRYELPEDQLDVVDRYTKKLVDQLVELAAAALADSKPANLSWGTGLAGFVMNRREFTDTGIRLGFNPTGYVDRSVPVLRVDSAQGKLLAAVFGCACHNTTCTGRNFQLSGDYAGFAQEVIQTRYPGAQAMFVIGCAADANPYPRSTPALAIQHGTALGTEVCRVLETELQPVDGPLRVELAWANLPLEPIPSRGQLQKMVEGPSWLRYNAQRMLDAMEAGQPLLSEYTAPIAAWQFGDDLTLLGLPGETVGGYVPLIQKAVGHRNLWIAGYTNDCFGYLPTTQVLAEGGYETRGLIPEAGFFTPETEDAVLATVRRLAEKVARPLTE